MDGETQVGDGQGGARSVVADADADEFEVVVGSGDEVEVAALELLVIARPVGSVERADRQPLQKLIDAVQDGRRAPEGFLGQPGVVFGQFSDQVDQLHARLVQGQVEESAPGFVESRTPRCGRDL